MFGAASFSSSINTNVDFNLFASSLILLPGESGETLRAEVSYSNLLQ